mgnify:FL=1
MLSPSTKIGVGVIGVGSIALDHASAILQLGHSIVAACATSEDSPRWKKFKKIAPEARFFSDIDALLEDADVEAIVVCLPWFVTEGVLAKLLVSSKRILIEKPVALSANALEDLLALPGIDVSNKIVGFNRRFYSSVQTLKERINKGGIKTVEISITESVARLGKKFGPSIIPNILVYNSCHILDTSIYLLGELKLLKNYSLSRSKKSLSFQSSFSLLETDSGVPVSLIITEENPLPVGIRVLFDDETTWHLSPMEQLNVFKGYDVVDPVDGVNIRKYVPRKILTVVEDNEFKPGFLEQMNFFLEGHQSNLNANLPEHLRLLKFIESLSVIDSKLKKNLISCIKSFN